MAIKDYFKKLTQNNSEVPQFADGKICRFKITFVGRVQFVGFRFEIQRIASEVGATGWVMNDEMDSDRVYAEIQGTRERVDYIINYMHLIERIKIMDMDIKEIPIEDDKRFVVKTPY